MALWTHSHCVMATLIRQMTPSIHFLVPFKSNASYLKATLTSIIAQSMPNWTATVFDDSHPPDQSRAIIEALNDPRINLVCNPSPLGIGGNWNAALTSTQAEFASLIHADDVLAPSYAQAVLDLHQRYPDTYGAFTGVRIVDHMGRRKHFSMPDLAKKLLHPFLAEPCVLSGDEGLRILLRGDFIFCPTVTYRTSRLVHPVFDENLKMSLDLLSFAQALIRGEKFVGTRDVHYFYRRHAGSTTSVLNSDASRFEEELRTYRQIADIAEGASFSLSARTGRRALIVKSHASYLALVNVLGGKPTVSRQLLRVLRS